MLRDRDPITVADVLCVRGELVGRHDADALHRHQVEWVRCVFSDEHIGIELKNALVVAQPHRHEGLLPIDVHGGELVSQLHELAAPSLRRSHEALAALGVHRLAADIESRECLHAASPVRMWPMAAASWASFGSMPRKSTRPATTAAGSFFM